MADKTLHKLDQKKKEIFNVVVIIAKSQWISNADDLTLADDNTTASAFNFNFILKIEMSYKSFRN